MAISPVAGNSSKAMERHLGSSYLVVLAVSKVIEEIKAINSTIVDGVFDDIHSQLGEIAIVANIKGEVVHVASISDDVVAVASIKEHVVRVSTDSAAINRVHESIEEVVRVNASADNVDRIHTSIENLDRVFASIENVDAIMSHVNNVDLVGQSILLVNTVAENIFAILAVAANLDAVNNVSANMDDVIQASVFVDDIHESVAEATRQADIATVQAEASTLSAQESEASRVISDQNKEKTNQDKEAVTTMLGQTTEARDDVITRQSNVQSLHDEVERDRQATHEAKVDAELAEQLSEMWATGGSNGVPSESNNAKYYSEVAKHNANQTFKAGGYHTPVAGNEYPNITGLAVDTVWLIKFPSKGMKYTFTSGQLKGITVENGYMMVYDTPENSFDYIPTSLTGAGSVNGVNPDATNNVTLKAINFSDIYSKEEVEAIVAALEQRIADNYVAKTRTINGKPLTTDVVLNASDVNAIANTGGVVTGSITYNVNGVGLINVHDRNKTAAYWRNVHGQSRMGILPDRLTRFNEANGQEYKVFDEGNTPTANQVGAVPATGGEYTGEVKLPSISVREIKDSNGTRVAYFGAENDVGNYYGDTARWLRLFAKDGLLQVIDQTNAISRVYHEKHLPSAAVLKVAPSLVNKAVFIPAGTTAQRPAVNDYPADSVALRMNTTLNEMEAVDPTGQVIPIGGGGMPALIPATTTSLTVEKKKAYAVDMSDGINKTIDVTQGMLDNDWFSINTTLWDKNVEGLAVTINFGSEVITNGKKDFSSLVIDRPCIAYFTKVNSKWMWSDGAGLDGSYEKLLRKIEELEKYPTVPRAVAQETGAVTDLRWVRAGVWGDNVGETKWWFSSPNTIQIVGIIRVRSFQGKGNYNIFTLPQGYQFSSLGTFYAPPNGSHALLINSYLEGLTSTNVIKLECSADVNTGTNFFINVTIPVERV